MKHSIVNSCLKENANHCKCPDLCFTVSNFNGIIANEIAYTTKYVVNNILRTFVFVTHISAVTGCKIIIINSIIDQN